MNIENFREYCLSLPFTTEGFPFDNNALVFKVHTKMFALIGVEAGDRANLKCDPERAIELRETYEAAQPGYHMSKKHWNTIHFNQDIDDKLIFELVDHSYELVFKSLPKKVREELHGTN